MHPIKSPQTNAGLKFRQKQWKINIEAELCSTQWWLDQGRNKEIKDFLEFNENEGITYPNVWDTNKEVLRWKLISECFQKETGEGIHNQLNSTPESSKTKRSKYTQEE